MSGELIAAIIAAIVSIIGASITIYGQLRTTRLQHELQEKRELQTREHQTQQLVAKYRDPLLRSAYDLQSRFYNIIQKDLFNPSLSRRPSMQTYVIDNTLYVIAEYLGWIEILRREIQFLDLGNVDQNIKLSRLLSATALAFSSTRYTPPFRLFKGQQRAIGELMMTLRQTDDPSSGYECMGYASFSERLHNDSQFELWFTDLKDDISNLANEAEKQYERLVALQNTLIDLINFLDPTETRFVSKERRKVEISATGDGFTRRSK